MSITFKRLTQDSGVIGQQSSIQPVEHAELLTSSVLQRPSDNLRVRTEELARAVESLEYMFQSVSNSSVLLRAVFYENTHPCLLKVYSKDFLNGEKVYYILPSVAEASMHLLPSMVVLGSSTNTFSYIVNDQALSSFYNQGDTEDQHNYHLGLKNTGDTICLRIPTVNSNYTAEVLLPKSTSELDPAGEAAIDGDLVQALNNDAISAADFLSSAIKIPSRNSIQVPSSVAPNLITWLESKELAVGATIADTLKIKGVDSTTPANETQLFTIDLNGIVPDGSDGFILPNAGYREFAGLYEANIDTFQFFINQEATPDYTETAPSVLTTTLLPKNEYLYPLAVHTGDSIQVPGLGGVRLSDVVARQGEAFMDSAGIIIGETGEAVTQYNSRTRIRLQDLADANYLLPLMLDENSYQYFRLPIDTGISEAGVSTELYLTKLELHAVLDEAVAAANPTTLNTQELRNVKISIGLCPLEDQISTALYKSGAGIFWSLFTCIPGIAGNSEFKTESYDNLVLTNFPLQSLKDDYTALIELPDSIRNTSALNRVILVWIYREDNHGDFFTSSDFGSINLDLRFTWETRLPGTVNLASESSLFFLGQNY